METNRRHALDASVWRSRNGRTLIGGSDFTIVGLDDGQRDVLDQLLAGDPQPTGGDAFARFLCDRNLLQPVPRPWASPDVALVIPCRNHQHELDGLLAQLDLSLFCDIIVVDDGSSPPLVVAPASVRVIRHTISLGSAAARNTGWRTTSSEVVLFLDADVRTDGAWIAGAGAYLNDPQVAAVAPRVRSMPHNTRAGRWEQVRPALDLGDKRSRVRPRTRVPYVPTAALLVRRSALELVGGFDPSMSLGEDVDLVWRLDDRGQVVRYEPGFEVGHLPRSTIGAWLRQRVTYGRSNVALANSHQGHVVGIELAWWNAAPLLLLVRSRLLNVVGVAATTIGGILLWHRLADRCDEPVRLTFRLQRDGIAYAAGGLAQATRRTYWPLAWIAAMFSRRGRWVLLSSLLPPSLEWLRHRRDVPFHDWVAAILADDLSFGAGLWLESVHSRSVRALRVHLSAIDRFLPDAPKINRQRSN